MHEPLICKHNNGILVSSSPLAAKVGYKRPREKQRINAALAGTGSKRSPNTHPGETTFPSPLLLPGDELFLDPTYPAQSLRSFMKDKDRNPVTPERNVIYVLGPPSYAPDFPDQWKGWTSPIVYSGAETPGSYGSAKGKNSEHGFTPSSASERPTTTDVVDYLSAFYQGLEVKNLPPKSISFTTWDGIPAKSKLKKAPRYIGLRTATECIRIRARTRRDDDAFPVQLNLNDIIDGVISLISQFPDAYSILVILSHDIYEDDDDDFACGRAYGGSRVAVVSMARYNPVLDSKHGIDRDHSWPSSHCNQYVTDVCKKAEPTPDSMGKRKRKRATFDSQNESVPHHTTLELTSSLSAAVQAFMTALPSTDSITPSHLTGLWLSRVCLTASHELGHCFGMDHCVYYACVMQGTSTLAEDARQPPYLCPVDSAKLCKAIPGMDEVLRSRKILELCEKWEERKIPMFEALKAWMKGRLGELLDNSAEGKPGPSDEVIEIDD